MYQSITANDLEQDLKEAPHNILDVRDADAFVEGHIPDAINIPINELPEKLATLDKEKPYTIIFTRVDVLNARVNF